MDLLRSVHRFIGGLPGFIPYQSLHRVEGPVQLERPALRRRIVGPLLFLDHGHGIAEHLPQVLW